MAGFFARADRRFAQTAIHRDRQPDDFENAHDSRLNLTYIR